MSDSQVQQVKQSNDIVQVIGERLDLKRAGRNFKALCPFHSEKTPSFFVSPEMQTFKCFGCGQGGDVFTFLEEYEGMTFPEALNYLADKAGIELKSTYDKKDDRRDTLLEIIHLAVEYYHYLLTQHESGETARQYAKEREIHQTTIKDFQLGYAPQGWRNLYHFLHQKKGYANQDIEDTGLIIRHKSGNYYDRFRGRLMFPLKTFAGQTVGFSGRILEKEAKTAKYINSPETSLYHKSELLFGLHRARSHIRKKDRVVLVEGELDVIQSYQHGVKEAVAVKGSALTEKQAKILNRLTQNLIMSLDADEAGQDAMLRAIETTEQMGLNIHIIELEGGKDPDDIIRNNPKKWRDLIKSAIPIYEFYLNLALKRYDVDTGIGQKQLMQFIAPRYARIQNAVERSFYTQKLAQALEVSEDAVTQEINKAERFDTGTKKRHKPDKTEATSPEATSHRQRLEHYLLSIILQMQTDFKEPLKTLKPNHFQTTHLKKLVLELKESANQADTIKELINLLPDEKKPLLESIYTQNASLLEANLQELQRAFKKAHSELTKEHRDRKRRNLAKEIAKHQDDPEKLEELRREYRELVRQDAIKSN